MDTLLIMVYLENKTCLFFFLGRLDKGETLRVLYWYPIGQMKKGAVAGEVTGRIATKESMLTIGCAYAINPRTLTKAKMRHYGDFGAG